MSTYIEDKGMEVTGHTDTQSSNLKTDHEPKRHVKMVEGHGHWDLAKPSRQIRLVGFIMYQLAFYREVYDPGGGVSRGYITGGGGQGVKSWNFLFRG